MVCVVSKLWHEAEAACRLHCDQWCGHSTGRGMSGINHLNVASLHTPPCTSNIQKNSSRQLLDIYVLPLQPDSSFIR